MNPLGLTYIQIISIISHPCLQIQLTQTCPQILRLGSRYTKPESDEGDETLTFSNGLTLTKQQLECGGFGTLTEAVLKFLRSLHDMECDDTEFALLSAVCLISGGEW